MFFGMRHGVLLGFSFDSLLHHIDLPRLALCCRMVRGASQRSQSVATACRGCQLQGVRWATCLLLIAPHPRVAGVGNAVLYRMVAAG